MYEDRPSNSEESLLIEEGYGHLTNEEYDKAEESYTKALEINPENSFALLNLGVVYQNTGKTDQAVEMYNKLIELDPDDRAFSSTDESQEGLLLTEIAQQNLNNIQKQ